MISSFPQIWYRHRVSSLVTTARTKGEQTRQTILDAAIERFGHDGFRSTSVAEVARGAEVGGTVAYTYFENKEALFLAALDEDVAGVINEAVTSILEPGADDAWRGTLIFTLIEALEQHPLARRVVAGLEPQATGRVIELPALADLRLAIADRLRSDQEAGLVRPDIDPDAVGSGSVTLFISLLMSTVQFGLDVVDVYGPDVMALLGAAIDPIPPEAQAADGT